MQKAPVDGIAVEISLQSSPNRGLRMHGLQIEAEMAWNLAPTSTNKA